MGWTIFFLIVGCFALAWCLHVPKEANRYKYAHEPIGLSSSLSIKAMNEGINANDLKARREARRAERYERFFEGKAREARPNGRAAAAPRPDDKRDNPGNPADSTVAAMMAASSEN